MLDEEEFVEIARLYRQSTIAAKQYRERWAAALKDTPLDELYRPVRDRYERLTGRRESNHDAVMHHRLSLYGPPCQQCHKPLRTPKAKLCASCMTPVTEKPHQPAS
jgi:plasmid stabilization system protein ParE